MDIESIAKRNALYRMLCDVENLRSDGKNWVGAVYGKVPRFPSATQKKIRALITREQKKNREILLGLLHKMAENPEKLDEITLEMARSQRFNAALAQLEAATANRLFEFMWGTLDKQTEEAEE